MQGKVLRMRSWKHSSKTRRPWAYAADPSQQLFREHSLFRQSTLCCWPVSLWLFGRFLSSRFSTIASLPPPLLTFPLWLPFLLFHCFSLSLSLFISLVSSNKDSLECSQGWTWASDPGRSLKIPLSSLCWDYKYGPPHPVCAVLGIEPSTFRTKLHP